MVISELLRPTTTGDLEGVVVEAVSLLPLDDAPSWEGDDSIHRLGAEGVLALRDPRFSSLPAAGPRVVPFVRTVRPRMGGKDVIAFQRALQAAGFRKRRPSGWHGPISVANLKAFQHAHSINATGIYGKPTHHALLPFFDAFGGLLMMQAFKAEKVHEVRQRIVATALYGVAIRNLIDYSQGPHRLDAVRDHLRPPRHPSLTDCSGFATWDYEVAGAPDPCGFHYDVRQEHYTGTMAKAGRKVMKPSLGDLVLYGKRWPYDHVVIYIGNDRGVSHGSASGPLVLPIHYRDDIAEFRSYV